MQHGMETREIGGESKLVSKRRDFAGNWEGTETTMVEFVGGTSRLNVATQEPHQLIRLVLGRVLDVSVVVSRLNSFSMLKLGSKFGVDVVEPLS